VRTRLFEGAANDFPGNSLAAFRGYHGCHAVKAFLFLRTLYPHHYFFSYLVHANHMDRHCRHQAALLLAVFAIAGCGSAGTDIDRHIVSGMVTLDGKPLEGGTIQFSPGPDVQPAIFSGTSIENGTYRLPSKGGLPPGTYQVSISSAPPPAATSPSDPEEAMKAAENAKPVVERIPPQYNLRTELTITVKDAGETTANFELKSGS
jgi:hypothetical protein